MVRSVTVAAKRLLLVWGLAAGVSLSVLTSVATAVDTTIDTTVCSGTSSNASLTVTSPISDSIVDELPVIVTGSVNSVTQIEVTIDGQYNGTIPISATQTSFSTALQLTKGTHTIELTGNDVCQFENPTQTIVISYEPKVVPGGGTSTPVETPSSEGSAPGGAPSGQINQEAPAVFNDIPVLKEIVPVIYDVATALDIDATAKDGGIIAAMTRFAAFTTGVALSIFGTGILKLIQHRLVVDASARSYVAGAGSLQDPKLSEHFQRNRIFTHTAGLVLLIGSFFI